VANQKKIKIIAGVYNINTAQRYNFHQTLSNVSLYQKGIYSFVMKVFNNLPPSISSPINNIKQLKSV